MTGCILVVSFSITMSSWSFITSLSTRSFPRLLSTRFSIWALCFSTKLNSYRSNFTTSCQRSMFLRTYYQSDKFAFIFSNRIGELQLSIFIHTHLSCRQKLFFQLGEMFFQHVEFPVGLLAAAILKLCWLTLWPSFSSSKALGFMTYKCWIQIAICLSNS